MKTENPEDVKNPETPPVPEPPAKPRKEKKEKKKKEKKQPKANDVQLPVLVELAYSISVIFLIFVGLAVMIVSVITGASLLNLVLRTSAAILAMGSLTVLIFHQISSGVLQASLVEQEEAQKVQPEISESHESPESLENFENPETTQTTETPDMAEA